MIAPFCICSALLALTLSLVQSEVMRIPTQLAVNVSAPGEKLVNRSSPDEISGELMKAFLVAHEAFMNDPEIPSVKRRVENYDIVLGRDGQFFLVHFIPRSKAGEAHLRGGETELGKEVSYKISIKDYRIALREFYR